VLPTPVLLTFALVLTIIGATYYLLILRPEDQGQSALRRRLKSTAVGAKLAGGGRAGLVLEDQPLSQLPVINQLLEGVGILSRPLQKRIDRSGLSLTVGALVLMCLCTAAAVFLAVSLVTQMVLGAAILAVLASWAPIWFVGFKARGRVAKFEEQFPEAIDLLSRALKAGHAFTTGLSMVAEEMPDPVGTEFRLAYDRQNFGMPLPDVLKSLGERVPLLDARFFVTAVLTQREAGGNLSEVLDNLAVVIRERFKVKRQIRVVTAHARITGWVLAMMPPVLGLVLTMLSPKHMSVLWTDPTGIRMVVVALILQVVGTLIIRKLVDVEY
jgi:tight adherence protein B